MDVRTFFKLDKPVFVAPKGIVRIYPTNYFKNHPPKSHTKWVVTYDNLTADIFLNSRSVNIGLLTTISPSLWGTLTKTVRIKAKKKIARVRI